MGAIGRDKETIDFIRDKYYNEKLSMESIGKLLGTSASTISKIMKQNNFKARTDREQALKYVCNEHYFDSIDTEEKAYWLGFMYADGFIQNKRKYGNYKVGLSLTESDREHLEKLKNCLESNVEIKTYIPKTKYNSKPYCKLLVTSNILAEGLIKHGCVTNKTELLTFPDWLNEDLKIHFIRGYIDGDGSVCYWKSEKDNKIYYGIRIIGTNEMIEGIQKFLGLNLKTAPRWKDRDINNTQLNIGGNRQVVKLLDLIYENANIYLDRKYEKYLEIKRLYNEFINNCRA